MLAVMFAWVFLSTTPKRVRHRWWRRHYQQHHLRRGWAAGANMHWAAGGYGRRLPEAWGLPSICSGSGICPACWCTSSGERRCMIRNSCVFGMYIDLCSTLGGGDLVSRR